jgi:hypothetical protein
MEIKHIQFPLMLIVANSDGEVKGNFIFLSWWSSKEGMVLF